MSAAVTGRADDLAAETWYIDELDAADRGMADDDFVCRDQGCMCGHGAHTAQDRG